MGKSVRKYRKNRDYDYIAPEKASAYDIHDGKGTAHSRDYNNDLLSSPREFVSLEELAPGESSLLQVAMLLVAGSVGSTVIVLPFVFLEGGFLMTIFMELFFSLASYFASVCLVQLGVANGIYSLQGLAKLAFGIRGAHAVGIIQMTLSCGLILTYLAIIFQDFPVLLGHLLHLEFDADGWPKESSTKYVTVSKILADRTLFAELFGFIVLIPFCLFAHSHRKIQNFAVVSTFLLLLTSLCIVGKAKYFHDENVAAASQGFKRDYLAVPKTICQAFGVLAAQFACQHHTFHAFYAIKDRSIDRFARVSLVAGLVAAYLAYSFGIGGYVSFLSESKTDMVGNQDFGSKQGTLPFWLLVPVCAMFCIPLEVVSSRYAAVFMCRARSQHHLGQEEVLFRAQPATMSQQYTASTTPPGSHSSTSSAFQNKMVDHRHDGGDSSSGYSRVQLVVTFLVLAILVQIVALPSSINIATLLSVTGGIAGIAILLVVPAACYLKLAPPHDDSHRPADSWLFTKCLPWSSIGIGLVASVAVKGGSEVHISDAESTRKRLFVEKIKEISIFQDHFTVCHKSESLAITLSHAYWDSSNTDPEVCVHRRALSFFDFSPPSQATSVEKSSAAQELPTMATNPRSAIPREDVKDAMLRILLYWLFLCAFLTWIAKGIVLNSVSPPTMAEQYDFSPMPTLTSQVNTITDIGLMIVVVSMLVLPCSGESAVRWKLVRLSVYVVTMMLLSNITAFVDKRYVATQETLFATEYNEYYCNARTLQMCIDDEDPAQLEKVVADNSNNNTSSSDSTITANDAPIWFHCRALVLGRIKTFKEIYWIRSSKLEIVDEPMRAFLKDSNITDTGDLWCGNMLRLQESTDLLVAESVDQQTILKGSPYEVNAQMFEQFQNEGVVRTSYRNWFFGAIAVLLLLQAWCVSQIIALQDAKAARESQQRALKERASSVDGLELEGAYKTTQTSGVGEIDLEDEGIVHLAPLTPIRVDPTTAI